MKDSTGRYLTKALFIEHSDGRFPAPFTLKSEDDPVTGAKSLKRLYMEAEDPTEALFAEEVFGEQGHWWKLRGSQWFARYADQWHQELEDRLAAEGVRRMIAISKKTDKDTAARWLAEKGWKPKRKAGRPTSAEIERERKTAAEDASFYGAAAERMFEDDD